MRGEYERGWEDATEYYYALVNQAKTLEEARKAIAEILASIHSYKVEQLKQLLETIRY